MSKAFEALISPHKFTPAIISNETPFDELWQNHREWVFSNLAHIAYFREQDVETFMQKLGATSVTFYSNDGAQAYLAKWNDKAVLAFRGTQLMEHLDKKYEHLGFIQKMLIHMLIRLPVNTFKLPLFNNDVIADLTFCHARLTRTRGVKVHSGFLSETKKLWKQITRDIRRFEGELPLWVTGHSLGGAMALITAMKYPVEGVYSFGSPRVGRGIKKVVSLDKHNRYVNGDDIVTTLPPSWFSYYLHHGSLRHMESKEGNLLLDHSIVDYSKNTY